MTRTPGDLTRLIGLEGGGGGSCWGWGLSGWIGVGLWLSFLVLIFFVSGFCFLFLLFWEVEMDFEEGDVGVTAMAFDC